MCLRLQNGCRKYFRVTPGRLTIKQPAGRALELLPGNPSPNQKRKIARMSYTVEGCASIYLYDCLLKSLIIPMEMI